MKERNNNKYDIFLILLISFVGFGTIGGALAPSKLITIILFPILLTKWKICLYLKRFLPYFLFFYVFCLASMVWTPDPVQGAKELIYYPIQFIYFFEILAFSKFAKNPLNSIAWGWTIMIFFCSFIAIWEITTDNHLSMAMQVQHMTASVTFHNPNSYVTVLCYSFPWIVYLTLPGKHTFIESVVIYYSIIASIIVIMFNMSRGGFLSFIVMGGVFLLLSPKSIWKTIMFLFIGGVIAIILITYGEQIFLIMDSRISGGGLTHDDARSGIWLVCLHILANYVFVGAGVGSITAALESASTNVVASPHSLFFEMLAQYGVLFTFIFLLYLWGQFKVAWKLKERYRRTVLMMAWIALPVYTIIDSSYMLGMFGLLGSLYVFTHIDKIKQIV